MKNADVLLTADWLLTQDANRRVIEQAAVAVSGGRIAAVGTEAEVRSAWTAAPDKTLALGHALVMPGLVNAHTHASMSIFRGLADDLPLMEWLTRHIWPVEKHLTREIVHLGALLACAEMLATGTTTFCDMYLLEHEVARAVDASGMRAVVGEGVFVFPSPAYQTTDEAFRVVRTLADDWAGHPRVSTTIAPHAVYTTTPDILRRTFALAEELDVPWNIHAAESVAESAQCVKDTGKRPIAYLDSLGLLAPRSLLHHCVDLTPEEIELLAARGARVAHCPRSNMKLASGLAPVPELLDAGVTVGLGTDGAASNNGLNMFADLNAAALIQKTRKADPTAMPAQRALDMATVNGAACLGRSDIGAIAPGMRADLIALDLTRPNLQPMYCPASHAAYAATGHEVALTMVEGEVAYRSGVFSRIDYPGLLAEIAHVRAWVLKNRAG